MAEKVIIIGSGPAGWTSAIYTSRAELLPIVFEGSQPGGQLTTTTEVENWPGYPEGIMGPDMMDLLKKQAEKFGTRTISETVTEVDLSSQPFKLKTDAGNDYETETLIIATGASAKYLGIPGEEKLKSKGVSACATCDGFFFKGKEVAVVGGGDAACEEANFLTKFATKVYMLVRGDQLRASKIMQERVEKNPNVEIMFNTSAYEVLGEERLEGLKIKNSKTEEDSELKVQGMFVAIGHKPNTDLFTGALDMDELGYIKVESHSAKTNVEGVFAAGDVADRKYRQAITAAGMGCMAAIEVERLLASRE